MAKYHPVGVPFNQKKVLTLSNREVKLIRMMRKVEEGNYFPTVMELYKKYEEQFNKLESKQN